MIRYFFCCQMLAVRQSSLSDSFALDAARRETNIPLTVTMEKLKGLHINSIVFKPCGNVPAQGDFFTVVRQNIENLKMVFEQ